MPTNPMPAAAAAGLRLIISALLPFGVSKGWWGESDVANIGAILIAVGTAGYGVWKTHQRQTRLVKNEGDLP